MKKYIPLLLSGALMVFTGIYMILNPDSFLTVVILVFGIYLIIDAVRTLLFMRRFGDDAGRIFLGVSTGKAIMNLVMGLLVVIIALASPRLITTLVVYIAGAAFLLTGLVDLFDLIALSRMGAVWQGMGLETVLSFVFALILFLFPNFLTGVIMTLFAAILLSSGALMVYGAVSQMIFARKITKMGESK
ncbi:MAG: DUF308 domain-containing protein [Spirochaetes bacterium]|uniref:DUF308 domain-containing protein n=1 Tax=Candidatus Ornithospirochaeta stercoripullorum TaxID=2840899 RepID=A0A9D9DZK7_9SPIO|nr:DUF308 domain-containing protein [Candidatus Ornithospirochaeta stercoripullorum]